MVHVIVVIHFVAVPRTDQIHFVANFNTHAVMSVDIESEIKKLVFWVYDKVCTLEAEAAIQNYSSRNFMIMGLFDDKV